MEKWIVYDRFEYQFEVVESEEAAKKLAEEWLEIYRDASEEDGWPNEEFEGAIGYGKLKVTNVQKIVDLRKNYTDDQWIDEMCYSDKFDIISDYELEEIV